MATIIQPSYILASAKNCSRDCVLVINKKLRRHIDIFSMHDIIIEVRLEK